MSDLHICPECGRSTEWRDIAQALRAKVEEVVPRLDAEMNDLEKRLRVSAAVARGGTGRISTLATIRKLGQSWAASDWPHDVLHGRELLAILDRSDRDE